MFHARLVHLAVAQAESQFDDGKVNDPPSGIWRTLRTAFRYILWLILCLVIAFLVFIGWYIWQAPAMLTDMYGKWYAADAVVVFHQKERRLPVSWVDLREVIVRLPKDDQPRNRGPRNLRELHQVITIDFALLPELERLGKSGTGRKGLPKAIYAISGRTARWSDPNWMVYEYFRTGEMQN